MRPLLFVALTFTLVVGVVSMVPAVGQTDDAKLIQGTWVVDPNAYKDVKDQEVVKEMKAVRVVFKGDSCTFKHPPGIEEKGSFRLDPSKKPKQIDISPLDGKEKGKTIRGVYELDGDKLTLHVAYPDSTERPTDLESKEGAMTMSFVLERVKK